MNEDDTSLSGSDHIDQQLLDIMDLILKDYVYPWSEAVFLLDKSILEECYQCNQLQVRQTERQRGFP